MRIKSALAIVLIWFAIAASIASEVASGGETYTPAPLQLLEKKVAEHDQQIGDLDKRLTDLEQSAKAEPVELGPVSSVKTATEYDYDGAVIIPGSRRIAERTVAIVSPTVAVIQPANGQRRLKSSAELQSDIRRSWTSRTYATMARGQAGLVKRHLTSEHGYTTTQVNPLSQSDAAMLHNLAHGPRISPYTSGSQRAEWYDPPTGPTPPMNYNDCPNGQCERRGGSSAAVSGWFPGKLLFGR